jgi:hypothetical protein
MPFQTRKPEWSGSATDMGGMPWDMQGRVPADILPFEEPNEWGQGLNNPGREGVGLPPSPRGMGGMGGGAMAALLDLIRQGQ